MKRLNITVTGIVQGVWFRASTKEQADRLGVNGFVRNQDDGSVYLEAEAETAELEQLLAWLKVGPPKAQVEEVKVEESAGSGIEGFEIRR